MLDLLWPPRCAGCRRPGTPWCPACAASVQPAPVTSLDGVPVVGAGRLAGAWQRAIHTYKYRPRPRLAGPLADRLHQTILAAPIRLTALTFVPLWPARQHARGFNQAEQLGRCLAHRLRLPLHAGLARQRDTPPQVGLDEEARRRNVLGAFRWAAPDPPPGGLGLIDDVCTTGATVRAAAAAIREAGGGLAAFLVLAVAPVQTLAGPPVTSGRILGETPRQGEST